MRQSRTSGSVGGLGGNSQAYPTALGRRVEKAVTGGATTRYILDGVQVVEEFNGSNVWQARYVYEDGIDQPRCMDRADIADVNGNSNTTEILRFHYHQQALGSVTEMTQPTGAVVEWVTYDVYGKPAILSQTGGAITQSAVGNPYLYTGREFDPESGLFFYRARQYDPGTGRFLQRDPLGYVDGLGLYQYAQCAPTDTTDPLGAEGESKFRKMLKENIATRAGDASRNEFGWAKRENGEGPTTGPTDGAWEAVPNKETGAVQGLITTDAAAALDELFRSPGKFNLDCAAAALAVYYMAILDTFRQHLCDHAEGTRRFNQLFCVLLLCGEWAAGSRDGNAAIEGLEFCVPQEPGTDDENSPFLLLEKATGESEEGDLVRFGGENTIKLPDEVEGEDRKEMYYGHGDPDPEPGDRNPPPPHGIHPKDVWKAKYGDRIGAQRLRYDALEKAAGSR